MKKILNIIILTFTLVACSVNTKIIEQVNSQFRTKYPDIEKFGRTDYQERLRERILSKFINNYQITSSELYVLEIYQNRGGDHVFTDEQTVITYFWHDGKLLEVYSVNDDNKLEVKKDEYWGTEHIVPTLQFIQEKLQSNQLDSIYKFSESKEHQISHAGEFFITEFDKNWNIKKVLKSKEFEIE